MLTDGAIIAVIFVVAWILNDKLNDIRPINYSPELSKINEKLDKILQYINSDPKIKKDHVERYNNLHSILIKKLISHGEKEDKAKQKADEHLSYLKELLDKNDSEFDDLLLVLGDQIQTKA